MKFSEKLQALRKGKGLSQEKLGNEIGVSRQAITKWENGTAQPEVEKILILSEFFNVTTDYLLKDYMETPQAEPMVGTVKKSQPKVSPRIIVGGSMLGAAVLIWLIFWVLSLCFPAYSLTGNEIPLIVFLRYHQLLGESYVVAGAGLAGLLLIGAELWHKKK